MPPRKRIEMPTVPKRFTGAQQQVYARVYLAAYRAYFYALRNGSLTDLADRAASVAVRHLCSIRQRLPCNAAKLGAVARARVQPKTALGTAPHMLGISATIQSVTRTLSKRP